MANPERLKRIKRTQAIDFRFKSASLGQPPNTERRLLKRLNTDEAIDEAIDRAKQMSWWINVIDPIPQFDLRYFWWFVRLKI
jgi:hypothetical protein